MSRTQAGATFWSISSLRLHASDVSSCLRTRASRSFRCRRCRNDVHRRHFLVCFRRDSTGSHGQLRPGYLGHRKESVPGSRWGGAGETREMHRVPRKFILSGLDGLESFEPGQSFQLEPGRIWVRLGLIGPVYPVKPTPSTWTPKARSLRSLKGSTSRSIQSFHGPSSLSNWTEQTLPHVQRCAPRIQLATCRSRDTPIQDGSSRLFETCRTCQCADGTIRTCGGS